MTDFSPLNYVPPVTTPVPTTPVQFLLDGSGRALACEPDIRDWWTDPEQMNCKCADLDAAKADGKLFIIQLIPTATMWGLWQRNTLVFDANERQQYAVQ